MTTFAIIALTVLGTIGVEILIIGLIDAPIYNEDMCCNKSEKLLDDKVQLSESEFKYVGDLFKKISKYDEAHIIAEELVQTMFRALHDQPTESMESYLKNLSEYKKIIDDSPDKFLDFHFQNSIRDEQYELSQYISNVAKKKGMILKAELN